MLALIINFLTISARFYVNISPGKKLHTFIRLCSAHGAIEQEIQYEHSPVFCVKCRSTGHGTGSCKGITLDWRLKSSTRAEICVASPNPDPLPPNVGDTKTGELVIESTSEQVVGIGAISSPTSP
ncbi:hypothetical protein KI387_017422, partial [Taxus chinensis]